MSSRSVLLRMLKLEGVDLSQGRRSRSEVRASQRDQSSETANPWLEAGRVEPVPAPDVPWQTGVTERRVRWYWPVLRGLLAAALLVVVLVGARTILVPPEQAVAPAATVPAASLFPTGIADGVAERFATSYLTWDEARPQARTAALKLDMAGLSADNRLGWDGKGSQTATNPRVLAVDASDETRARITVVVNVSRPEADGTTSQQQTALVVPVAIVNQRAVVTATPVTVAVPPPSAAPAIQDPAEDDALGRDTRDYAQSFFTAYGRDSDVSAVSAPDARIAGLGGLYTLKGVKTWLVFSGTADSRQARADVQWATASGALLEQTYDLTLTRVSAGDTSRWQVAAVTGSLK